MIRDLTHAFSKADYAAAIWRLHELGKRFESHPEALDVVLQHEGLTLNNPLPYCIFEEAWIDGYLRQPIFIDGKKTYRRYLSPKAHLNKSTRHRINLGMRVFASLVKKNTRPITPNRYMATLLDQKACRAIARYGTTKQRLLTFLGKSFGIITSLVFSLTIAATTALLIAAWPLPWVMLISIGVFIATALFYWSSNRKMFPRMLRDVFGKDKWLEGWTHYRDPETGQKKQLTKTRKILLGCAVGFAVCLSVATALVTYSFIAQLGQITLFSFLAAGTIGASLLPPVGIAIATVLCVGCFIYFMQPLVNMLQSKNFAALLLKPFKDAAFIFDPHNVINKNRSSTRLKAEKIIVFSLLGLFAAVILFGLIAFHLQQAAALTKWLDKWLALSTAVAIYIANTISTCAVLIGQLPYLLKTLTGFMMQIVPHLKKLFQRADHSNQHPHRPPSQKIFFSPSTAIKETAKQERFKTLRLFTTTAARPTPSNRARHYHRDVPPLS